MKKLLSIFLILFSVTSFAQTIKQKQVTGLTDSFNKKLNTQIATVYTKGTFSSDFFYTADTALTLTGNVINFNSTTVKTVPLVLKNVTDTFYHNYERWEIRATVRVDTLTQGSDGFIMAAKPVAPGSGNFGVHIIGHGGAANYMLGYMQANGANLDAMPSTIQITRGDVFNISIKRDRNYLIASVQKVGQVPVVWSIKIGNEQSTSYHLPIQLQDFRLELKQGGFAIQNLEILAGDANTDLAFVGNSITAGISSSAYANGYTQLSRLSIPNSTIIAGPGMYTQDVYKELKSILLLNPKRVSLLIGTNDFGAIPLDSTKLYYRKIVDTLTAHGITPILISVLPRNTATASPPDFNTWIQATFPTVQYIDMFTGMKRAASDSLLAVYDVGDGLHPNDAGHSYMANIFLKEYSKYYAPGRTRSLLFNGEIQANSAKYDLATVTDTTNYKPTVTDALGKQHKFSYWPNKLDTTVHHSVGYYDTRYAAYGSGGGGGINNSPTLQSDSRFHISGNGVSDSALTTPRLYGDSTSRLKLKADTIRHGSGNNVFDAVLNAVITTDYSNTGGTGDRSAIITITTDASIGGGIGIGRLINGDLTTQNTWLVNASIVGKEIKMDFGTAKIITEIKWYQSTTDTHGTWKVQGSANGSSWTDIGSSFTLGGATTQTITTPSANTTAYRYYRLFGVSGAANAGPWIYQIEFKISGASASSNWKISTSTDAGVTKSGLLEIQTEANQTTGIGKVKLYNTPTGSSTDSILVKASDSSAKVIAASTLTPSSRTITINGTTHDLSANRTWTISTGGTQSLSVQYSDVGNVGTGEDDLITYSMPGNTLTTNEDRLEFKASYTLAANTNSKTITLYFGTTSVVLPANTSGAGGTVVITGEIIRTSSSTVEIVGMAMYQNGTTAYPIVSSGSTLDFTSTLVLKTTGTATSDNDILNKSLTVTKIPAPAP